MRRAFVPARAAGSRAIAVFKIFAPVPCAGVFKSSVSSGGADQRRQPVAGLIKRPWGTCARASNHVPSCIRGPLSLLCHLCCTLLSNVYNHRIRL
jgi:hypothetical protein